MVDELLGEIIAAALTEAQPALDFDNWAQSVAAHQLADEVAARIDVHRAAAFDCLLHIPDNLLPMLHSPQGWTALAGFIAGDLGASPPAYCPTIH